MSTSKIPFLSALAYLALGAPAVNACTVCMGGENTNIAGATNGAIFLMLGMVFFMLASFGGFMVCMARRARQQPPPHVELTEGINELS